jgi:hypothetical protein
VKDHEAHQLDNPIPIVSDSHRHSLPPVAVCIGASFHSFSYRRESMFAILLESICTGACHSNEADGNNSQYENIMRKKLPDPEELFVDLKTDKGKASDSMPQS